MANRSQKTGLSPSATTGGGIDLKKNEAGGIDLGRKTQPSISNTGIGLTQDVGNVGGLSVKGGVSIDISPIDFGISGHPSFEDPSQSAVSISGGAEIPGGLLGVSGGVTINTSTGEIEATSIGAEVGGFGVNVSASATGDIGVEFTYQIPFTPIELSIGFGTEPKPKEPKPKEPTPTTPFASGWGKDVIPPIEYPPGDNTTICHYALSRHYSTYEESYTHSQLVEASAVPNGFFDNERGFIGNTEYKTTITRTRYDGVPSVEKSNHTFPYSSAESGFGGTERALYTYLRNHRNLYFFYGKKGANIFIRQSILSVVASTCPFPYEEPPFPPPSSSPPPPPPFPNPPPQKRNMNECCRDAILLLRGNRRFLQEVMIMLGRPLNSSGNLVTIPPDAKYFGEPIERIKTPIKDISDPQKETIVFNNYYQLLMYNLRQQISLDEAVDPQSFQAPTGKLQNPNYQRNSEESLATNIQPDEDKGGNKRELEIGTDIKINSLSQQQQYLFQAVRRLEYLFPAGELADARFDKNLIIPGATGQLQIHNLIHFKEFLVQFLNATLGNPKIPIKMEDINAIKEGKQEAIFNHFSISHMIRELYKLVLESGDDINAIMETTIRDFRTNLANRIQIVQIAEMAQALVIDTGMLESQEYIPVKLDGDPYAGKWKPGQGFEPDEDLDSNDEKATEKLMRATLKNFKAQVKVIRRDKKENADVRDLLLQLAEMFIRSNAIPATPEGIEKALTSARFREKVNNALTRSQVKRAAAAKLSRTKKRKK